MKPSDTDILEELKIGNTSVLKYCYDIAFPKVRRMVISNSGLEEDARDVFQDAIIIFYKNSTKTSFNLTSTISTYLYAISWRLWMKSIRDNKFVLMQLQDDFDIIDEFDFELTSQSKDIMEEVVSALESIGKNCKEIIMLFYFNKLNYDQIADRLNYKDDRAVREQKYRCMKRIKEEVNYAG